MLKRPLFFLIAIILASAISANASDPIRQQAVLNDNWRFILGDPADAQAPNLDDASWRSVTLPHDWSIEGHIDPKAPMGGQSGFFPSGIGWYRLHLDVPASWKDKKVEVEFEGVYMNADVYFNGQKVTSHPYGFTSFFVDLTPVLNPGSANILAVRVDNSQQKNCRWYPGSGIYRHVRLFVTGLVHVAPWGVFVSTPKADTQAATLSVKTQVQNETATPLSATIHTVIKGPDGKQLAEGDVPCQVLAKSSQDVTTQIAVTAPPLWSPETPQVSTAVTSIIVNGTVVDETSTPFGVRAIAWSVDRGLTLNGKTYKLSGGCIHDDNGVLGACAFDRAEERKIQILKQAGYNAIRTAHNPPSPELLDACDRLGMLVLDEAFDCWESGKSPFDYHLVFKDWWQRDIDSMVERDRNHPSVVMWSIGNEIPYIFSASCTELGPKLVTEIHSLDSTRPVTNGINASPKPNDPESQKNADTNWNSLDIVGSNYRLTGLISIHNQSPNRMLVSTESNPPLGMASQVAQNSFVVGDFVWTAQDYLGESGLGRWFYADDPTGGFNPPKPGDKPDKVNVIAHGNDRLYPWHGADCGGVDLIGNIKPGAHWRAIIWNMGETLAMGVRQPEDGRKIFVYGGWGWFPTWESWTWPGMEGKPIQVEVYSSYPAVRLYLNGHSVGDQKPNNGKAMFTLNYQPGQLKAVGLDNGQEVGGVTFATADQPAAIRLTPDRSTITADGQDLSFVKVEVVDKNGAVQPNADEEISFALTGPGTIAGLGNANMKSEEPYQGTQYRVFHGKALLVLRSTEQSGALSLTAHADGLADGAATIKSQISP